MAKSVLDIILRTKKEGNADVQASKGLGALNDVLGQLGLGSLGTMASVAGLAGAVVAAGKFAYSSVKDWQKLALQVDEFSRLTAISTEESSKMIEVAGDLGISYESLSSAMEAATRKGVDTSLEGLKALSEQYLSMPEGLERSKFLMDNFGRSGADLGEFMEQGADGLQKLMDKVSQYKTMSEGEIKQAKELRAAQDGLNDTWDDFKLSIGGAVAGPLTKLMNWGTKYNEIQGESNAKWVHAIPIVGTFAGAIDLVSAAVRNHTEAEKEASDASIKQGIDNIADGYTKQAKALSGPTGVNPAMEEYNRVQQIITNSYSGFAGNMAALRADLGPIAELFGEVTDQILWQKLAADADAETALKLAENFGLLDAGQLALQTGMEELKKRFDQDHDGIIANWEATNDYYIAVANLKMGIDALNDKSVNITFTVNGQDPGAFFQNYGIGAGWGGGGGGGGAGPGAVPQGAGKAAGGWVNPWTEYTVGEYGPERFRPAVPGVIIPNGKGGGGGVNNFYFNVPNELTAAALAKKVTEMLARGY